MSDAPRKPDYDWHREGMWDTDDPYRRAQRAMRDIQAGRTPRNIIVGTTIEGNDKKYRSMPS